MSYIEKLLEGMEVEWKALGEVAQILNGFAFKSSKYVNDGIRVIRISDVQKGKMSDKDLKFYPHESENEIKRYLLRQNDLVMSLTGYVGRVAMLSESDLPAGLNQRVACIRPNNKALTRFLFHYLDRIEFEADAIANAVGGGQKNMSTGWLSSYQIPIPPLSVQKEIVRILDTFTELTAELTAELIARKQQYSFYREELLRFEEGEMEWKTLGEVMKVQRGKRLVRSQLSEIGDFAVYQNSMIPLGYYHEYNVKSDTTFIICAGAAGEIGYSDNKFWAADDVSYLITPDNIKNKFVYYYLLTQKHKISSQVRRASIPRLSKKVLEKILVPIPPLEEQERIVSILDKFDTLTNSISEGLPKEIELRKKQYEYYRNELLTFPK